jgi:hypothetical protein
MSPDIYNCRLNAVNIMVSLITFLIPAINWVLYNHKLVRAYVILGLSENLCLAFSCAILVWGFQRLIKILQSGNDHLVKKSMISWHIVAYFLILIANIVENFTLKNYYQYEVSVCFNLAIGFVCSFILAIIANQIVTKYLESKRAT